MKFISSVNNSFIKEVNSLKIKKYRDKLHLFLVEGYHLVEEAIKKGIVKTLIIIDDSDEIEGIETIKVSLEVMNKISDTKNSQNIIALCHKLQEIEDYKSNYLLLDRLQDPGNIGTLIRSALAFGFNNIVLSDGGVDLYNEKLIRASQGMLFHVNIITKPLNLMINDLKTNGYKILGTSVNGNKYISNYDTKIALILGNEGSGVSDEVNDMCDEYLTIETSTSVESLNVAVAGSIIMHDLSRGKL